MGGEAGGSDADAIGVNALEGPERDALDQQALTRRLRELTGTSFTIDHVERAGSGHVNGTLLLDSRPVPLVVKIQSDAVTVHGSAPALEPLVLRGLHEGGAPVPAVVAVDPDPSALGSPWFAMERIDGVGVPDDAMTGYVVEGWLADASPEERRRVFETFVDCLARVHEVPVDRFTGFPRGGSHSRVIDYLRMAVEDAAPGRVPRQQRLLDLAEARMPAGADDDVVLCMGDARMANALVREGEVVALVDWEIAFLGNPAVDIGYHLNHVGWLERATGRRLDGIPTTDEAWERWEARTGRSVSAGDRRYWTAFASMVLTVTASRVIASFLGGSDDPGLEEVNPMVPWSEELFDG